MSLEVTKLNNWEIDAERSSNSALHIASQQQNSHPAASLPGTPSGKKFAHQKPDFNRGQPRHFVRECTARAQALKQTAQPKPQHPMVNSNQVKSKNQ